MNKQTMKAKKPGMGFLSTLTMILVVLKLAGLISWPWLWVFSPIWITLSLIMIAFAAILVGGRVVKGKW